MASPPIPPSLEHLVTRPFSFYPAIINIEHNEWLFRKATWSEILVVNCKSATEIWIPRRFIGEVSRIDDPVLIVGLNRELEYKVGAVWPYQRRIIEMPVAVGGTAAPGAPAPGSPAPIVGIRLETNDRRILRLIGGALAVAISVYVLAVSLNRVGEVRQRKVTYTARDEAFLDLSSHDDYASVVRKLGQPGSDRWRASDSGDIQVRALSYPNRKYTVILVGTDRGSAAYIGTLDDNWRPMHSSGSGNSALLRTLKRF